MLPRVPMPPPKVFPATQRTWVRNLLTGGEDSQGELLQHLMLVYAQPLQLLARQRLRHSEESACDLVHGFLAARLGRDDYLAGWERSGLPLHRWLWNGLCFYDRERQRAERRLQTVDPCELDDLDDDGTSVDRDVERAFAVQLVRAAFALAEQACRDEGFGDHWEVFVRRKRDGCKLGDIARELGLPLGRVVVMQRAPTLRFRHALHTVLERDGVRREDVPRAIDALLESAGS